jgi:hypothetical protein
MMWMGIALAIVAWGSGVWMGVLWTDYTLIATRTTHKKEMDEIFAEVKRLRAQVAGLIGT